MRILAVATGSTLPSQLEQRYVVEAAVLPDYESGLTQLDRGYDVLLAGDRAASLEGLSGLLAAAARAGHLQVVLLPSHRSAGFPTPDGVITAPVDAREHELAAILGLVRRPLEGNRVGIFYTLKGGGGKTTVTVNTAVALKLENAEKRCVLWDLDLPKGNVFLAFGKPNALTLGHLLREPGLDLDLLARHIYHDPRTGVDLLLAPTRSDLVIQLQPATFLHILSLLRATYDFVLLDFEPEIHRNEILVVALHEATDIVLVSDFSEFAENALERLLPILTTLGVRHKVRLVYNNIHGDDMDRVSRQVEGLPLPTLGIVPNNRDYEYAHRQHRPPMERKLIEPFRRIARNLLELGGP